MRSNDGGANDEADPESGDKMRSFKKKAERGKDNAKRLGGKAGKREEGVLSAAAPGSEERKIRRRGSCRDRIKIFRPYRCPRFRTGIYRNFAAVRENSDPPSRSSIAAIHTCMGGAGGGAAAARAS